ncbi:MAG: DUF3662 and FHA domain-containing protein [Actinomycetota bacterium]|nr:DUF3662 and FHA domain-containing protein [Actinomycetota bacterium]
MGLADIENRLERLIEGAFGRLSRKGLQPSELGKKVVRQMELEKRIGVRGPIVPNHYMILLSPDDFESMTDISTALHSELLALVQETARERRYKFVGFLEVGVDVDQDIPRGTFAIESQYQEDPEYFGHLYLEMPNGMRVPLADTPVTIGRLPGSTIVIDEPRVSRRHAEVTMTEDGVVRVRDLGSTNGTRLNGVAVTDGSAREGDEIDVGGVKIQIGRQ